MDLSIGKCYIRDNKREIIKIISPSSNCPNAFMNDNTVHTEEITLERFSENPSIQLTTSIRFKSLLTDEEFLEIDPSIFEKIKTEFLDLHDKFINVFGKI